MFCLCQFNVALDQFSNGNIVALKNEALNSKDTKCSRYVSSGVIISPKRPNFILLTRC